MFNAVHAWDCVTRSKARKRLIFPALVEVFSLRSAFVMPRKQDVSSVDTSAVIFGILREDRAGLCSVLRAGVYSYSN